MAHARPAPFALGGRPSLADLFSVAHGRAVSLGASARKRIEDCRRRLLAATGSGRPVYGVNTGFGELASRRIGPDQLTALQRNLVLSHACGVGEPLEPRESRAMLFLRANELARGYSGVRRELVETMLRLLKAGAAPVIPSRGSVGASGDLAPQAHMALLLIGRGEAFLDGRRIGGAEALRRAGAKPLSLQAKEGLALLNGTQAMQAVGGLALARAFNVFEAAQAAGTLSLEALTGTPDPFDPVLHKLKPHPGQLAAARQLHAMMADSQIRQSHREDDPRVQDPYSLRCLPQVHGAVLEALENARVTVETEMSSVTDNPVVIGSQVRSGGHFHGQALAFAFDFAAIALTALGNMSERRIAHLVSGRAPKLSPFLAQDPGLESGWMIPQVVAAALASENKVLAHPASADSIPTSGGQEDFVSMGMAAALKFKTIVSRAAQIVAIELLAASQAVEAHAPLRPGRGPAKALALLRQLAPRSSGDEELGSRIESVARAVLAGYFGEALK
ncbi:MAG: histidine ammonia-lyase [Elusimicrobia bacterium]|nr:histidine ammonia-lyase [Elusimicrobiota bacterium]